MGDLLRFPAGRAHARAPHVSLAPAFFFDVTCPFSYLTAERVERRLPGVEWVPADGAALAPRSADDEALTALRARAEAQARALRLPLVWPEQFPLRAPCAQRAAAFACELGAGPAFALAASRLAFCGGYELDDPEIIAEAAAAAAVPLGPCLEAAGESWRDQELGAASAVLRSAGLDRLPAFRVGVRWLQGDEALSGTSALLARGRLAHGPLAPAG